MKEKGDATEEEEEKKKKEDEEEEEEEEDSNLDKRREEKVERDERNENLEDEKEEEKDNNVEEENMEEDTAPASFDAGSKEVDASEEVESRKDGSRDAVESRSNEEQMEINPVENPVESKKDKGKTVIFVKDNSRMYNNSFRCFLKERVSRKRKSARGILDPSRKRMFLFPANRHL